MADGHALIEINTQGQARLKDVWFYDIRLTGGDIEEEDMAEQILEQLPEGINDVLVLVVFRVEYLMSYHYEYGTECDGVAIHLESHNGVVHNYKEFYREQLTEITKFEPLENENEESLYREEIAEWEEFYDEDFLPFVKKSTPILKIEDLLTE